MRLTWRDVTTTILLGVVGVITYLSFSETTIPLISRQHSGFGRGKAMAQRAGLGEMPLPLLQVRRKDDVSRKGHQSHGGKQVLPLQLGKKPSKEKRRRVQDGDLLVHEPLSEGGQPL